MEETISIRIKKLRLEIDLTQEDLALKLGLKGKSSIANYESGKITPSDEIKIKMCKIFNCTLDYLMCKSDIRNYDDFKKKDIERLILQLKTMDITEEQITKLKMYLSQEPNKITYEYEEFLNSLNPKVKQFIINDKYNSSLEMFHWAIKQKNTSDTSSQLFMTPVYGKISAGQPNWAEECLNGYLPIDPNLMGIINPEECFFLKVNGESMNKVIRNGAYALIRKQDIVENGEIAVVLVNGFDATLKKFTKQNDLVILEPMSTDTSFSIQVYDKNTQIKILGKYIGKFEIN